MGNSMREGLSFFYSHAYSSHNCCFERKGKYDETNNFAGGTFQLK